MPNIRQWINIVELGVDHFGAKTSLVVATEAVEPRPQKRIVKIRPWKSLAEVTMSDILNAVDEDSDLLRDYVNVWTDFDDLPDPDDPNHRAVFHAWAAGKHNAALSRIKQRLTPYAGRQSHLYRGVDRLFDVLKPLGPHWTISKQVAELYGNFQLEAIVGPKQIDWVGTLARGVLFWSDDKEITIIPGSRVRLIGLQFGKGGTEGMV